MKKLLLGTTLLFLFISFDSRAQVYTDQFRLGLGLSYPRLIGTDAGGKELNYGGQGSIEVDFSEHVGLRAKPFYTHLESQSTKNSTSDLFGVGFAMNYYFVPEYTVTPYLTMGISGFLQQINKPVDGKEEGILDYSTDFGIGVVVKNFIAQDWDLNAELSYHSVTNDRLDGVNGPIGGLLGGRRDSYLNFGLGVLYNFGFGPKSNIYPGGDTLNTPPMIERYPYYINSWKYGFGFLYPRLVGTDELGKEWGYGGYFEISKNVNESVVLRLRPSYSHMIGSAKGASTDLVNAQFDLIYRFLPFEPVTPYLGVGGSFYAYAVNKPTSASMKDGAWQIDYGINFNIGADWKLFDESYSITTELDYITVAHDRLDGHINMSSPVGGILGGPYDSYMTFTVGISMYLDRGDKSEGPALCNGLNVVYKYLDTKDPNKVDTVFNNNGNVCEPVDYNKIEEIVKKYQTDPIDYNKIEDIIKQYSGKDQTQSWVLYGVNFDFASAQLRTESYPILNHAAQILISNPAMNIEIGGHTDAIGSEGGNVELSEKRAQSVRSYLIEKGIEASRLTAKGYGSSVPVSDNGSAEGRAMNRRVEFKVVN
jgi:outer membrane protein OmpA-like peptidoglycan-associated protein